MHPLLRYVTVDYGGRLVSGHRFQPDDAGHDQGNAAKWLRSNPLQDLPASRLGDLDQKPFQTLIDDAQFTEMANGVGQVVEIGAALPHTLPDEPDDIRRPQLAAILLVGTVGDEGAGRDAARIGRHFDDL